MRDNKHITTIVNKIVEGHIFSHNSSGVTGVYFDKKRNNWRAQINFEGKRYRLGSFKNKRDAINARKLAEEEFFHPILDTKKSS